MNTCQFFCRLFKTTNRNLGVSAVQLMYNRRPCYSPSLNWGHAQNWVNYKVKEYYDF